MEFKQKIVKKRHARNASKNKKKGMVRVKVRGRKRWILPKKSRSTEAGVAAAGEE